MKKDLNINSSASVTHSNELAVVNVVLRHGAGAEVTDVEVRDEEGRDGLRLENCEAFAVASWSAHRTFVCPRYS